MPTTYPKLEIGAAVRLRMFKAEAASPHWPRPMTWRDVRFATLSSFSGLSQGLNGDMPVWYTHSGPQLKDRLACKLSIRASSGWYGDTRCHSDIHSGIVAKLPHGRYLAGYLVKDSGERIYFGKIFYDAEDAAIAADEHASAEAEQADICADRSYRAAQVEGLIQEKLYDVEKSFALRNHPKLGKRERKWTREVISDIRGLHKELEALNS